MNTKTTMLLVVALGCLILLFYAVRSRREAAETAETREPAFAASSPAARDMSEATAPDGCARMATPS